MRRLLAWWRRVRPVSRHEQIIRRIKARGHWLHYLGEGRQEWHGPEYQTEDGCTHPNCRDR